jgi:hypothetical protein
MTEELNPKINSYLNRFSRMPADPIKEGISDLKIADFFKEEHAASSLPTNPSSTATNIILKGYYENFSEEDFGQLVDSACLHACAAAERITLKLLSKALSTPLEDLASLLDKQIDEEN